MDKRQEVFLEIFLGGYIPLDEAAQAANISEQEARWLLRSLGFVRF
jgi:hypothetical protein